MTTTGYLIWFVATAFLTVTILAVGTLAAAGHFVRDRGAAPAPARHRDVPATSTGSPEARRAA
jgi:hypothetical protein